MEDKKIRLFLADDHTLVRQGIAALFANSPDIEVVGECGNGLNVIDGVFETKPDVVVLDLAMPGLNGVDVCRQLTRKAKGVAVLILTMYADEEFIVRSLENGANGYLLKTSAADQAPGALEAVAGGDFYGDRTLPIDWPLLSSQNGTADGKQQGRAWHALLNYNEIEVPPAIRKEGR